MRTCSSRRVAERVATSFALLFLLYTGQAYAAGCLLAPAKISDATIAAFKQRPGELLERFPAGGPTMSAEIMRNAGSEIEVLPEIIGIARQGTTAHRVAIGIGLARAATVCTRTNPDIEQRIKQAVSDAALSELSTAFAAGMSATEQSATFAASSASDGSAFAGGPLVSAGGGSDAKSPVAAGGPAGSADLLNTSISGSMRSFSSRGLTSTTGNTVSPTRR